MKLSTKGRYGLRAMVELARHYGTGITPLNEVAEKQEISSAYLEQLMSSLRKSGLVHSVRGAQGGYRLTRPPNRITVECVDETGVGCARMEDCCTVVVWERLRDAINDVLDSMTLQDLMDSGDK